MLPASPDPVPRPRCARTLSGILSHANLVGSVGKNDVAWGDSILVRTKNSTYWLTAAGEGVYFVSGGWFDQQSASPVRVTVNGCTWGGSSIHEGILAAPGLFLEFGNGVTTTRIQQVLLLSAVATSGRN